MILPREQAPLGRVLPYHRAAGEGPASPTSIADDVARQGWSVHLGERGLGDLLLGLAAAQALAEAATELEECQGSVYQGPRQRLLQRCHLPLAIEYRPQGHSVTTGTSRPVRFRPISEAPPTWLDEYSDETTEVHACLPMRYYLDLEQSLGMRLGAPAAPLPTFASRSESAVPYHVVFITTTSWPQRKDYGLTGFTHIAKQLTERVSAGWRFTIITPDGERPPNSRALGGLPCEVLTGVDAADCLDVFGSAQLVIGNDTGLTHLAALCARPNGTGPHVVGLYARHGHTKWTTGRERHHAVATRFSQMMSTADACPVRDGIDDALWGAAADIATLPPEDIADFAGHCVGWW